MGPVVVVVVDSVVVVVVVVAVVVLTVVVVAAAVVVAVQQENPLVVPLQEPLRYVPLGQLMLEHAEHTASLLPEHPPLWYRPAAQPLHGVHVASDVPEHPPALNSSAGQVLQSGHVVSSLVLSELLPAVRYCPFPHDVFLAAHVVAESVY